MSVFEMDGDQVRFDPSDVVQYLSQEAKERLAIALACAFSWWWGQ
jgi:hypothetical protein